MQVVGADIAPQGSSAAFLGYWSAALNFGLCVGPLAAGQLSHVAGNSIAATLTGAFCLLMSGWYGVAAEETLGWEQRSSNPLKNLV